jgi:hypothetical protein
VQVQATAAYPHCGVRGTMRTCPLSEERCTLERGAFERDARDRVDKRAKESSLFGLNKHELAPPSRAIGCVDAGRVYVSFILILILIAVSFLAAARSPGRHIGELARGRVLEPDFMLGLLCRQLAV